LDDIRSNLAATSSNSSQRDADEANRLGDTLTIGKEVDDHHELHEELDGKGHDDGYEEGSGSLTYQIDKENN